MDFALMTPKLSKPKTIYDLVAIPSGAGLPAVEMVGPLEDWVMLKEKVKELRRSLAKVRRTLGLHDAWWENVLKAST